jgi:hypothetical protein
MVKAVESDMNYIEHLKVSSSQSVGRIIYSFYKGLLASVLNKSIFHNEKMVITLLFHLLYKRVFTHSFC